MASACAGEAPRSPPGDDEPGVDAPPPAPIGQRVSGKAMDYFGVVPMADSTITTDGIDPAKTATSIADGSWFFDEVPTGSKVFLSVAHANYRPTRNLPTTVVDVDVVQDVHVMSLDDVRRQYTSLGRTATGGTAFVAAELQNPDGTPLVGIPLGNVTLTDALDQPVPIPVGPFFFDAVDINPDPAALAVAINGRSRVALLDLPPGTFKLKVLDGLGATVISTFSTVADGATLTLNGGIVPGAGGGVVTDPTFATNIYPRLQKAALGGVGCGTCHTALGTGAILIFDAPAADVLASLLPAAPNGRIDTTTIANSLLLTKPLYELAPPQNHPNATFLDANDPDYKLFNLWITNGLKP